MVDATASAYTTIRWSIYLQAMPSNVTAATFTEAFKDARAEYDQALQRFVDEEGTAALREGENKQESPHGMVKPSSYWNALQEVDPSTELAFKPSAAELDFKTIRKDIERTYTNHVYFHDQRVHRMMERVLFVWLRVQNEQSLTEAPEPLEVITYQQGMTDLLAMLVIALRRDRKQQGVKLDQANKTDAYLFGALLDDIAMHNTGQKGCFLEHDVYILFTALMKFVLPYYSAAVKSTVYNTTKQRSFSSSKTDTQQAAHASKESEQTVTEAEVVDTEQEPAEGDDPETLTLENAEQEQEEVEEEAAVLASVEQGSVSSTDEAEPETVAQQLVIKKVQTPADPFLFTKIARIFDKLLPCLDPALHAHMVANEVMPQIFLLRWLRLLCCREFTLGQTMYVWDRIFFYQFHLLDFLCVSMLTSLRGDLFGLQDHVSIMAVLMRYPKLDGKRTEQVVKCAEKWLNSSVFGAMTRPVTKVNVNGNSNMLTSFLSNTNPVPVSSSGKGRLNSNGDQEPPSAFDTMKNDFFSFLS